MKNKGVITSKHHSNSPRNMVKDSPRNGSKELGNKKGVVSKTNLNTARNIDQIKKKLSGYKYNNKINNNNNNKYFKKQFNICNQL